MPYSNIRMEWAWAPQRGFYQLLLPGLQLIRYDCRGAGLSDRDVADYTPDAHALDILAVTERLGLERFALLGFGHSGGIAIRFAALHPERVSHLVLWCCYPRAEEYGRGPRVRALESLMGEDWEFWTRAEAFRLSEFEGGSFSNWVMQYIRESLTEEGSKAAVAELRKIDVTELMAEVRAPTLVLHRTGIAPITVDMAKEMAAAIPNARLMLLPGSWIVPYFGGNDREIAAAIRGLILETPPGPQPLSESATPAPSLTPRETEVLRLIASGRTSSEISHELSLSVRTVGRHITNIYNKIGARTRADATAYAIRHDLV
jgi:pimeloyl-ACP methyl ester carboxylesterase/DNA-binding CsgD family transcriptional regulator